MKHKVFRLIVISILLLTTFFIGGTAAAQDEDLPDPGITPDSPFYFIDKFAKNIGMLFTFGDEAKAKKALHYAEERLSEVQAMVLKNRIREMTRAADDYNGYMNMVTERLEAAARNGKPDRTSENVSGEAFRLRTRLGDLIDDVPEVDEEARAALVRARTAATNTQVNALRILGENKPDKALGICAEVAEKNMERVRNRISINATSGDVSEDLDFESRIAALEDELVVLAEEKGIDITHIMERLAYSTANRLQVLVDVYANAPATARQGIGNAIENSVEKYQNIVKRVENANISSSLSINITQTRDVQEKIRERLDLELTNQVQAAGDGQVNANLQVRTENEVQNREQTQTQVQEQNQVINTEPPTTSSQTENRQETENKNKNGKDSD